VSYRRKKEVTPKAKRAEKKGEGGLKKKKSKKNSAPVRSSGKKKEIDEGGGRWTTARKTDENSDHPRRRGPDKVRMEALQQTSKKTPYQKKGKDRRARETALEQIPASIPETRTGGQTEGSSQYCLGITYNRKGKARDRTLGAADSKGAHKTLPEESGEALVRH